MTTLLPEQIADLLDDAADAIEKYGWTRQQLGNRAVGMCAVGAIVDAITVRQGRNHRAAAKEYRR